MTRRDAMLIAEELHRLAKAENPYAGDELLSAAHICKRLDVSRRWFEKYAVQCPRIRIGSMYRYPLTQTLLRLQMLQDC